MDNKQFAEKILNEIEKLRILRTDFQPLNDKVWNEALDAAIFIINTLAKGE